MINSKLKSQKGVSMITLTIAIVILVIITNILIYNVRDNLQIEDLKNMQNDIDNLSDKISSYYAQYGKVPAKFKYTNIQKIKESGIISDVVDTEDKFYVIDLSALENLTLNYGQDYKNITSDLSEEDINKLEDLYIINMDSHNIFYVAGITIDNETFYTNYTKEDIDEKSVDLRYVDNVKIPDDCVYVEGNLSTNIKIKSKEDENKQYIWVVSNEEISKVPAGITVDNEEKFIKSVNSYKGYYKNTTDSTVIYLQIEDGWSLPYDKEGRYVDKNGDSAYIPQGFKVSKSLYKNMIDKGLVIQDTNGNSYVWVEVPKNIYITAQSEREYEKIEKDLQKYIEDYKQEEYSDMWYDGCGLTESQYNELKNKMLSSIYSNGGFWISQYEIGADNYVTSKPANETRQPVSKEGAYVYNYVECPKAQELATSINSGNRTSSLLFGIQWDLTLKFIEEKAKLQDGTKVTQEQIKSNSKDWGNYKNVEFTITKGKYSENNGESYTETTGNYTKLLEQSILLTTGASDRNKVLNIYDLAGNAIEWTLSNGINNVNKKFVYRGGIYNNYSNFHPANDFNSNDNIVDNGIGFRATIY